MESFTSVWDEAGQSAEAEASLRAMAGAKVASASVWPFLALARDSVEFGQRLDLVEDTLTAAATRHDVPIGDLVAAYTRQYTLLAESRKTAGDKAKTEYQQHMDRLEKNNGDYSWERHENGGHTVDEIAGPIEQDAEGDSIYPEGPRNTRRYREDGSKISGKLPDALKEYQFKAADEVDDDPDPVTADDTDRDAKQGAKKTAEQGRPSEHRSGPTDGGSDDEGARGSQQDGDQGGEQESDEDTRTPDEKYRDAGNWYREGSPGDLTSQFFDRVSHLKTALEEGVDPLSWIEGEGGGQGAPEKPIEHDTEFDDSNGYSEVPAGGPNKTGGKRHPFR